MGAQCQWCRVCGYPCLVGRVFDGFLECWDKRVDGGLLVLVLVLVLIILVLSLVVDLQVACLEDQLVNVIIVADAASAATAARQLTHILVALVESL